VFAVVLTVLLIAMRRLRVLGSIAVPRRDG
jgi:hypothetical protein